MTKFASLPRLFVPRKARKKVDSQPDYGTDMRAMEIWADRIASYVETINPSGGGGAYASLTGPGQTTTPGHLTQAGGLTVNAGSDSTAFVVNAAAGGTVQLSNSGGQLTLNDFGTNGDVALYGATSVHIVCAYSFGATSPSSIFIGGNNEGAGHSSVVTIHGTGSGSEFLQFFGHGANGAVQQVVSGSRGGNAALASLLTALANYGLIIDSTTP